MRAGLTAAMRERDALRTSVLRSTLSAIANAEAVEVPVGTAETEVPRRHLTDDDVRAVVDGERAELEAVAAQLRARDMHDQAGELLDKAAVLATFLDHPSR